MTPAADAVGTASPIYISDIPGIVLAAYAIGSLIRSVGEVVDALSDEGKRDEAYFVARNSSQVYPCDYTTALIDKCINSD